MRGSTAKVHRVPQCRVADPHSIGSVDPDPGGHKRPTKVEKIFESSCFEVLDGLFLRAEGFFCTLDDLYGGLGIGIW
jgi:hypothetical protein